MHNPFYTLREKYQLVQWKLVNMPHRKAWAGFVFIIGVAFLAVVGMICGIVYQINYQASVPADQGDDGTFQAGPYRVKRVALTAFDEAFAASTTTPRLTLTKMAAPQDLNVMPFVTQTVFSTTIIHVSPTTTSVPITSTLTTSFSRTVSSNDDTTANVSTDTTVNSGRVVMTGEMFCPATQRVNNVYTPCPYVHTDQPGMVDNTALPTNVVVSSDGRRRVYNPYPSMRKELPKFIKANKELIWRTKRLVKLLVRQGRIVASNVLHPDIKEVMMEHALCSIGGRKVRRLEARLRDLEKKNQRLREGIYNAQDVMSMQQDMLDSHLGVIENQRLQIEEAARFKRWWATAQNETGQHKPEVQTWQNCGHESGEEYDFRKREEEMEAQTGEQHMCY